MASLRTGIAIFGGFVWERAYHEAIAAHGIRNAMSITLIAMVSLFIFSVAERQRSPSRHLWRVVVERLVGCASLFYVEFTRFS